MKEPPARSHVLGLQCPHLHVVCFGSKVEHEIRTKLSIGVQLRPTLSLGFGVGFFERDEHPAIDPYRRARVLEWRCSPSLDCAIECDVEARFEALLLKLGCTSTPV